MRSLFLAAALACAGGVPASALVVLSGDSNILNALDAGGASPSVLNEGNQTLFKNILGTGDSVFILGSTPLPQTAQTAQAALDFFNSLTGVTATADLTRSPLIASSLENVSLFMSLAAGEYSAMETDLLKQFNANGGTIMLLGENSGVPSYNTGINALLSALGSTMSIGSAQIDIGYNITTDVLGPLASGVSSLTYAFTNSVSGGDAVARTIGGTTFIASEILSMPPPPAAIPLPASAALLLAALGGIGLVRARRA